MNIFSKQLLKHSNQNSQPKMIWILKKHLDLICSESLFLPHSLICGLFDQVSHILKCYRTIPLDTKYLIKCWFINVLILQIITDFQVQFDKYPAGTLYFMEVFLRLICDGGGTTKLKLDEITSLLFRCLKSSKTFSLIIIFNNKCFLLRFCWVLLEYQLCKCLW